MIIIIPFISIPFTLPLNKWCFLINNIAKIIIATLIKYNIEILISLKFIN